MLALANWICCTCEGILCKLGRKKRDTVLCKGEVGLLPEKGHQPGFEIGKVQ